MTDQIADHIKRISECPQNVSKESYSKTDGNEIEIPKEKYISREKRQKIIDELKLV